MSSCLHGTFSILSFFLIFQSLIGIAHAWDGIVVRVVDGDTLIVAPKDAKQPELLGLSVRLYGIDAPELSQPGGLESKAALERLAHHGADVEIIPVEADRYDRSVGVVMLDGMSLNIEQIRQGQACGVRLLLSPLGTGENKSKIILLKQANSGTRDYSSSNKSLIFTPRALAIGASVESLHSKMRSPRARFTVSPATPDTSASLRSVNPFSSMSFGRLLFTIGVLQRELHQCIRKSLAQSALKS